MGQFAGSGHCPSNMTNRHAWQEQYLCTTKTVGQCFIIRTEGWFFLLKQMLNNWLKSPPQSPRTPRQSQQSQSGKQHIPKDRPKVFFRNIPQHLQPHPSRCVCLHSFWHYQIEFAQWDDQLSDAKRQVGCAQSTGVFSGGGMAGPPQVKTVSAAMWGLTLALPARRGRSPLAGPQVQSWLQQETPVRCHHLKHWQVMFWAEVEICRKYKQIHLRGASNYHYRYDRSWLLFFKTNLNISNNGWRF